MVGIIIASHGGFAAGILESVSMLFGPQANMKAVSLEPKDKMEDMMNKMENAIASFDDPENIVFFTDIKGGTPYNVSKKLMEGHENTRALVSGTNLPMLITAVVSCMGPANAQEVAASVLKASREGITIYPETLDS